MSSRRLYENPRTCSYFCRRLPQLWRMNVPLPPPLQSAKPEIETMFSRYIRTALCIMPCKGLLPRFKSMLSMLASLPCLALPIIVSIQKGIALLSG
jgi:hypothetical protein